MKTATEKLEKVVENNLESVVDNMVKEVSGLFYCPFCNKTAKRKNTIIKHVFDIHTSEIKQIVREKELERIKKENPEMILDILCRIDKKIKYEENIQKEIKEEANGDFLHAIAWKLDDYINAVVTIPFLKEIKTIIQTSGCAEEVLHELDKMKIREFEIMGFDEITSTSMISNAINHYKKLAVGKFFRNGWNIFIQVKHVFVLFKNNLEILNTVEDKNGN